MMGLDNKEAGPVPWPRHYKTKTEYVRAWYLWRAIRRDCYLTEDEMNAKISVLAEKLGIAQ